MKVNADFRKKVVIDTKQLEWVDSPMQGVQRKMLDRLGAETGHATSIVRYAADSYFSEHTHDGGEEFLVLEGVFSDEHGDYPAGTYVRNPIGTHHKPHSKDGCTIFVKLHQFTVGDDQQFSVDTNTAEWIEDSLGLRFQNLHNYGSEQVMLIKMHPGVTFPQRILSAGYELLLLEGELEGKETHQQGTWLRNPAEELCELRSVSAATFYIKTGHLPR